MGIQNINFNELNIREIGVWPLEYKILAIIGLGIAIFFALYTLILKPSNNDLISTNNRIQDSISNFKDTFQQSVNLDLYVKQMVQIEGMLKSLLKKLPSKGELPLLLEDISQQAVAAGLTFDLIKPEDPIDKGFYFEQPIKMVLIGKYHNFGKFATGVAALPRIVTLHDFAIRNRQEGGNSQTNGSVLVIETYAKTYWYVDKEQL